MCSKLQEDEVRNKLAERVAAGHISCFLLAEGVEDRGVRRDGGELFVRTKDVDHAANDRKRGVNIVGCGGGLELRQERKSHQVCGEDVDSEGLLEAFGRCEVGEFGAGIGDEGVEARQGCGSSFAEGQNRGVGVEVDGPDLYVWLFRGR